MATITADFATRPRRRYLLDRPELIGPLFVAPAILYVVVLVALPFFLAIYYSVSAFTIFDPTYRFVGLSNFSDILRSEVFRRTLIRYRANRTSTARRAPPRTPARSGAHA